MKLLWGYIWIWSSCPASIFNLTDIAIVGDPNGFPRQAILCPTSSYFCWSYVCWLNCPVVSLDNNNWHSGYMIKKAHLAFLVCWGIDRIWSTRSPLCLLWLVGTSCCWLSMIMGVEIKDKRSDRCKLIIKLSLNIQSLPTHQKLSKSFHCHTTVPLLMRLQNALCWHLGIFPAPHGWISLPFL